MSIHRNVLHRISKEYLKTKHGDYFFLFSKVIFLLRLDIKNGQRFSTTANELLENLKCRGTNK